MRKLFVRIAVPALLLSLADRAYADDEAAWADAIGQARAEAIGYQEEHGRDVLFRSDKKSGQESVEKTTVDVSGAEVLWLKTDSLNDQSHFDLAAWVAPTLTSTDGTTKSLLELKPFHMECAAGKLKEIQISGKKGKTSRALLVQAPSRIGYHLDGQYTQFTTSTGFAPQAKKFGAAAFEVNISADGKNPAEFKKGLWERLAADFPVITEALLTNFGEEECLGLLNKQNPVAEIEEQLHAALGAYAAGSPAGTFESCGQSLALLIKLYDARRQIRASGGFSFPLTRPPLALDGLRDYILSGFDEPEKTERLKEVEGLEQQLRMVEAALMGGTDPNGTGLQQLAAEVDGFIRTVATEGGWSSFRGGNRRSAVSPESPVFPLYPHWVHRAVAPEPAWSAPAPENFSAGSTPLTATLTFDRAHHAAVWKDSVYYGSAADDAVRCLDAATGQVKWLFTTEGPVRLTPVVRDGKVYAASDDGFVYCLNAADGTPLWKYSPAPTARRVPGNGRIISIVPVRAGLCVEDGKVYFAAGLFPQEGTFLCALDAATGAEIYKQPLDISPQGAMLLTVDRIMVPTGRTPFVMFDRRTGGKISELGSSNSWGLNLTGGSFAVADGSQVVTGPSEDGNFHLFGTAQKMDKAMRMTGLQLAVQGDTTYVLKKNSLTAIDRNRYFKFKRDAETWRSASPTARTMLLTGSAVLVGGENRITAYSSDGGRELWQTAVAGNVESLAFNGGCLYASLTDGSICCFAPDKTAEVRVEKVDVPAFSPKGYCLIARDRDVVRTAEAAVQSGMKTLCVAKDPQQAAELVDELRKAGLYGRAVVQLNPAPCEKLPYTKYFANMVIADASSGISEEELMRVLRPAGGKGWFGVGQRIFTRPPLEGEGEWTHMYGDAGNSAATKDRIIRYGKTGLQWFGRPGPEKMVDRHQKNSAPLYKNGRLFIAGYDYLAAADAYNGTVLWELDLPLFGRREMYFSSGSMALDDSFLYAAAGNRCLLLDPQTGETIREIKAADGFEWGYVARCGSVLLGSETKTGSVMRPRSSFADRPNVLDHLPAQKNAVVCSDALFACSPEDGRRLWEYRSGGLILDPAIGAADGLVVFVECANPEVSQGERRTVRIEELLKEDVFLTAVDIKSGKIRWRKAVDLSSIQNIVYLNVAEGMVLVTGSKHVKTLDGTRNRYDLYAFRAADGEPRWNNTNTPFADQKLDDHGSDVQHPAISGGVVFGTGFARMLGTGEEYSGWKWQKSQKCATVSMSENCAFSRYAVGKFPYIFDKETGEEKPLSVVSRPGCWINMLPVGGLILIPEASSGCTCPYSIQTSMALVNLEE